MSRRIIVSVVGALAAASFVAPVAHAGAPAKVTVRVEAPARTLASATLTTTRTPVVKDGTHACSGTSVAGALEQATDGNWTGTWYDGLGYAVDAVEGVKPGSFTEYWTLWINGRPSSTGVCDSELQAGDDVLEFICAATPDFSSCENLPLALQAGRVRRGAVTVTVVRLNGDGTSEPVGGATVRGGVEVVTTGADGRARVALPSPQARLRATHAGDVPSAPLHCTLGDTGGRCGSTDTAPPVLRMRGIRAGMAFAAAEAPRVLRGVARDPSGVDVSLKLSRRLDGRCWALDGERGAFRRCGGKRDPLVAVGDDRRWSYLLPGRLAPGRYRLVVIATDAAGNGTTVRIRFLVEASG